MAARKFEITHGAHVTFPSDKAGPDILNQIFMGGNCQAFLVIMTRNVEEALMTQ